MLTAAGAKLLDFWDSSKPGRRGFWRAGLNQLRPAHALHSHHESFGLANCRDPNQQGTIVGTFQYMRPETLQGKEPTPAANFQASAASSTRC